MQAFYYKSKILTGTLTIQAFTYRCQTNIDWYTRHSSFYLQMPNKYWLVVDVFLPHTQFLSNTCLS